MVSAARTLARSLVASAIAGASIVAALPSVAHADAVVAVEVRGSRDATVVLRDANGVVGSCRTQSRTCEIHGVPPGRYTVSAQLDDGEETPGRPVMIPPDGRVSLIVAVP